MEFFSWRSRSPWVYVGQMDLIREPETLGDFQMHCVTFPRQLPCEIEPGDALFCGFSVQGHFLLPFTLYFNPGEATNENPKSDNGSERGHPAHFVFKINRCPLLTLRWD